MNIYFKFLLTMKKCKMCESNAAIRKYGIKFVQCSFRPTCDEFWNRIFKLQVPMIIKGFTINEIGLGSLMSIEEMKQRIGEKKVSVHVSQFAILDFVNRNFSYKFMTINELFANIEKGGCEIIDYEKDHYNFEKHNSPSNNINMNNRNCNNISCSSHNVRTCSRSSSSSNSNRNNSNMHTSNLTNTINSQGSSSIVHYNANEYTKNYYYYRSVGRKPQRDHSDLGFILQNGQKHIELPFLASSSLLHNQNIKIHSSVLRISQTGLQIWPHYDVPDNILIQIRGNKRIFLFPPDEVSNLYITESSSPVKGLITGESDLSRYINAKNALKNAFCADLGEGDMLFIPKCWIHSVYTWQNDNIDEASVLCCDTCNLQNRLSVLGQADMSYVGISVNVFFYDPFIEMASYPKNDPYGNRDLMIADNIMKQMDKEILTELKTKYPDREFYYRMILADYLLSYPGSLDIYIWGNQKKSVNKVS